MKTIKGYDAIERMREVSKIPGGCFRIEFLTYNRVNVTTNGMRISERAKARKALPSETFDVDSDLYFAFTENESANKMCWKHLIRRVGFPPNFEMLKVNWL
ncbi:MAG: hypothetical protein Q8M66_03660 [Actinomycetota bacterium]|nr:hypothetical protein [Actinomycetota bacterium]